MDLGRTSPAPSENASPRRIQWRALSLPVALLLLAFSVIWFSNLDYRRLVTPDEGRYAEVPREMVVTGDWLTPRLNGIKYFEKPALQYWMTAAAYSAFGVHEWTARLWPALSGFLGVLFIGYVGFRLGGPQLGLYSAAVLGGSVWYVLNAHVLTLDAGVTFWMSVGLGGLFIAQREGATPAEERSWMLAAWAALALAVLSKGLIGVVLPGAALVIYTLLHRDTSVWRRLHPIGGVILFLMIVAPWFVVVSMRNSEFFDFFFIHEHFTRFLTNEAKREGAWWYFIPVFLVGSLPWTMIFLWTARRMWTAAPSTRNGFSWQRFALVWAAFILVFFSASGSKLPSYILPMFPALALVLGLQLTTLSQTTLMRLTLPSLMIVGAFTLVALLYYPTLAARFATSRQPLEPLLEYGPWVKAACVVALSGGVLCLVYLRSGRRTGAILSVSLSSLLAAMLVLSGHDTLAEEHSSAPILARINANHGALDKNVPFYSVIMYDQTLPFYLGRTVIPVAYPDEMAMGLASEPEKAIPTKEEWLQRWNAGGQAYAIMPPNIYDRLIEDGIPMRELGRGARRVIVSRE